MDQNCRQLVTSYVDWVRTGFTINETQQYCEITTPFLDRHNDAIQIYVEQREGALWLTDDGYTIRDLRASGFELSTPKRRSHLASILNGFGVKSENDEIVTAATVKDFPQKKHNLIQAILAVHDLFALAEPHVLSFFKEDVRFFLDANNIQKFHDFKLTGKSGFDHKFDFALPRTQSKPERVLEAINNLTKDQAASLAWAASDIKAVREEALDVLVFINDVANPPAPDNVAALQAYDLKPLMWSARQQSIPLLNGGA